ncbi:hypothetical protein CKO41_14085 [Thiococcus pfennigii]|nr:hypothetical protein [Thiococcus pfennigii]
MPDRVRRQRPTRCDRASTLALANLIDAEGLARIAAVLGEFGADQRPDRAQDGAGTAGMADG